MSSIQKIEDWFEQKIGLICDPYFEREFFTNLIFCMDRKKSMRDVFEASLKEFNASPAFSEEFDRSLYHLYCSYQSAQYLREFYQWLPLAQGLYSSALYRSQAQKPIAKKSLSKVEARGSSLEDFQKMMDRGARRVIPFEHAWESFIFLLESRSTRQKTLEFMISTAIEDYDRLTAAFLCKAVDVCFANAWRDLDIFLRRPFERLWERGFEEKASISISQAKALVAANTPQLKLGRGVPWTNEWAEELWLRISRQGGESAWAWVDELGKQGASIDQLSSVLQLFYGRCLYAMKPEQWGLVTDGIQFADALHTAGRWISEKRILYIAGMLSELVRLSQNVARELPDRPTGDSVMEKFSANIGKNQLILRLDDAVETGDATRALDLAAILLRDRGLTHSLSDRLVLMAAKQDGWSFSSASIPSAMFLANCFEAAVRLQIPSECYQDAVYGLIRFYLAQRVISLENVKRQGHYGDGGLKASNFDVSGGARIVDRYVFNQLRNAQRIFIWPTEGKG